MTVPIRLHWMLTVEVDSIAWAKNKTSINTIFAYRGKCIA